METASQFQLRLNSQRSQRNDVRDRIRHAAYRLLVQHGFSGFTIDMVAEAAGVARATVYNRVGNRELLLRRAVEPVMSQLTTAASQIRFEVGTATAMTRSFSKAALHFVGSKDHLELFSVVRASPPDHAWLTASYTDKVVAALRLSSIRLVAAAGTQDPSRKSEVRNASRIVDLLIGTCSMAPFSGPETDLEDMLAVAITALLRMDGSLP